MKWGELPIREVDLGLEGGPAIGQWMLSNCIVYLLIFLLINYYNNLSLLVYFFTFFLIVKLFLSQITGFTLISVPFHGVVEWRGGLTEQLCSV